MGTIPTHRKDISRQDGIPSMAALDAAASRAADEVKNKQDQSDNQQDVNDASSHVESKSAEPEQDK